MKVVHLLGWYFPESVGGTEVYVAELARRQRAQGWEVSVAAPDADARDIRTVEWDGARVFRYPLDNADRDFAAHVARLRPDVVHVHSLVTGVGLPQLIAARQTASRVLFTAHLPALGFICQRGSLLRWGREACEGIRDVHRCAACALEHRGVPQAWAGTVARIGEAAGPLARLVPSRLGAALRMPARIATNGQWQQQLLDLVDWFVVLNRRAQEIVLSNGAPRDKVVLNRLATGIRATPKPRPLASPTKTPVRIGFVGRLHEAKGIDVLLRAFALIDRRLPLTLQITGPMGADDPERMGRLIRAAIEADPRISFTGSVDRSGVDAALRQIDVLCCPSVWFENGPTIALEAQAIGTPVIGSVIGAIPEIVTDGRNGRLFPPGDAPALADVLRSLAQDPAQIDDWREALPLARTMDDVAADYQSLYGMVDLAVAQG
ncbi:MAG TPA: glycosyltransferase [Vicinamibacterales bacterium]|nr:glycosyltransferase [Vicinamibacterales bacterium]